MAGIPDLRLSGDAYLSLEEDRAKALELASVEGGFEEVLKAYWRCTPEVPGTLADRYVASALGGVARGERHLDHLDVRGGRLLDVGCGTGGLLVAASRRGCTVTGIDIALRWLVVARRRLEAEGVDAQLLAADGAVPPFRRGSFGTVCCIEVLEHARDQRGLLHWCFDVAQTDGRTYVVTANRFSLAPEPTVGLFGVGYLPRALAPAYVRRRRSTRYEHFSALSRHELRAFAHGGTAGIAGGVEVGAAILPAAGALVVPARRVAERVYERLRRSPASPLLGAIAPYLEVRGRARLSGARAGRSARAARRSPR